LGKIILNYTGYISVYVTSTSLKTYVEAAYCCPEYGLYGGGWNVTLGGNIFPVVFPVLPCHNYDNFIEIIVGNTDPLGATVTVTITYYY